MISSRILLGAVLLCVASSAAAQIEVREPTFENAKYEEMAKALHEANLLEEFAAALNESLKLPVVVGVRFTECGEANAFYDPSEQQISMCFELLEDYYQTMADQYETQDELDNAVMGAFVLVLFHELGHALVHVLDLPITGREEDAVDQLAAWAMIDDDSGDDAVLSAALSYYASAERSGAEIATAPGQPAPAPLADGQDTPASCRGPHPSSGPKHSTHRRETGGQAYSPQVAVSAASIPATEQPATARCRLGGLRHFRHRHRHTQQGQQRGDRGGASRGR